MYLADPHKKQNKTKQNHRKPNPDYARPNETEDNHSETRHASLCLQATATEVLKSLPDDIWDSYGASGWGPDGKHAFMEFDYGGAWSSSLRGGSGGVGGGGAEEGGGTIPGGAMPRRARDLFEASSCAWAEFYGDVATLEKVGKIFGVDYSLFRWYDFDAWRVRLQACLEQR